MAARKAIHLILAGLILFCTSLQVARADFHEPQACLNFFVDQPSPLSDRNLQPRSLIVSSELACWDGKIEPEPLAEITNWAEEASSGSQLVIRSGGGDSEAALRLAQVLNRSGVQTVIVDVCASACANYLYSGVQDRAVHGQAVLLFHGGFGRQTREQMRVSLTALIAANAELFEDPEGEISRNLEHFDLLEGEQDMMLRDAGVDPSVIHDFDSVDLDSLPRSECSGEEDWSRTFVFFRATQIQRLGLAPEAGTLITETHEVDETLSRLGADFSACQAPEEPGLFGGAAR